MEYIIKNIHKNFKDLDVLKGINLKLPKNKVISILGPSGCGKTTFLNIISGIIKPDHGELIGFENKKISYLFQEPRLLKWKTVKENIQLVLKDKMPKDRQEDIIYKCLKAVGLLDYKNYYPNKLSGGMKQRVAIARAFAYPSDVLLMDEPFKSLDLELKLNLINYFLNLWKIENKSVIFVTHDIHAALMLGDQIYILTESPTKVKEKIMNQVPHYERSLKNKKLLSLEEKLYNNFSN